jgi:LPLT family lysophospholipid transporter-like MFS transporter
MRKQGLITEETLRTNGAIYTTLLFIPFILLAPFAGYLNDRYSKTHWLRGGNLIKLIGTCICGLSIWFGYVLQAPGYLIVGIGSCFYGPAKYGILPEILPRERLVKANGMVELLTLLAILTGTIAGSVMVDRLPVTICYGVLLGIFGSSLFLNLFMAKSPFNEEIRLSRSVKEFFSHTRDLVSGNRLGKILFGTALFWICGATMKINFQAWGLGVLHLENNTQVSLLGLWLSVGVMSGSMLAGQLHKVGDLRWTQGYGFGLAIMLGVLWTVEGLAFWHQWQLSLGGMSFHIPVVALLIATGFVAGLFLIPLNAALQDESPPAKLGKTIAVQNLFDNIGMCLAGALVLLCTRINISSSQVFLVLGVAVFLIVLGLRIPPRQSTTT